MARGVNDVRRGSRARESRLLRLHRSLCPLLAESVLRLLSACVSLFLSRTSLPHPAPRASSATAPRETTLNSLTGEDFCWRLLHLTTAAVARHTTTSHIPLTTLSLSSTEPPLPCLLYLTTPLHSTTTYQYHSTLSGYSTSTALTTRHNLETTTATASHNRHYLHKHSYCCQSAPHTAAVKHKQILTTPFAVHFTSLHHISPPPPPPPPPLHSAVHHSQHFCSRVFSIRHNPGVPLLHACVPLSGGRECLGVGEEWRWRHNLPSLFVTGREEPGETTYGRGC
ncbi:hypothetical protein E2C01_010589 [Portunus trituberculatus]|uniref:Uncharacterized protein n=1 Tax=Portunus trituberculatus TaxID=210409 RepID=A0A5B7D996_PORTR|nr:hypothetical protein [Portunus trituberculatus]